MSDITEEISDVLSSLSSFSDLEEDLRIRLHRTEPVEMDPCEGTFDRLAMDQLESLRERLQQKHGAENVAHVLTLLDGWKQDAYDPQAAQQYERLVKETTGSSTQVRSGGELASEPPPVFQDIYSDLYRASRGFIKHNVGRELRLFRGVRDETVAKLVAQAIDKPEADRFYIETSTISNHSRTRRVARGYSNGIVITLDRPATGVALAIGHIYDGPNPEDEYQILGGVISVPPRGVACTLDNRRRIYLTNLVEQLGTPDDMDGELHDRFSVFLVKMSEADVTVGTKDGASRIDDWWDFVVDKGHFPPERENLLEDIVGHVSTPAVSDE